MPDSKRLGRGLEALLGPVNREQAEATGALRDVAVSSIVPNPFQPRRNFDDDALTELTASIEASGLLQPVIVRQVGSRYELVAGERRWRAVQRLGWDKMPVIVRDFDDQTALSLALIENLQRDDLNALDAAHGYQRLVTEFKLSPAEVARVVGKDRSTVANTLRLLNLPLDVQAMIQDKRLSEGHGRALLALHDQSEISKLAARSAEQGWSVREIESQVRGDAGEKPRGRMMKKPVTHRAATADARRIEDALRQQLGTDVRLTAKRRGRGLVSISYYSNNDLSRLLEILLGAPFSG